LFGRDLRSDRVELPERGLMDGRLWLCHGPMGYPQSPCGGEEERQSKTRSSGTCQVGSGPRRRRGSVKPPRRQRPPRPAPRISSGEALHHMAPTWRSACLRRSRHRRGASGTRKKAPTRCVMEPRSGAVPRYKAGGPSHQRRQMPGMLAPIFHRSGGDGYEENHGPTRALPGTHGGRGPGRRRREVPGNREKERRREGATGGALTGAKRTW